MSIQTKLSWACGVIALLTLSGPMALAAGASAETGAEAGAEANRAEAQREELPSAESIFEKHIEAIGGREAVFAVQSRVITGIYRGAPFPGPVRMYLWQEAPNKTHMILADPMGSSYEIAFDGEAAWEKRFDGSVVRVEGKRAIEIEEMADFYGESDYKERYSEIKTMGDTDLDGVACWIVDATSKHGRKRSLLFEKESGLFTAERVLVAERGKQYIMQVRLSDYKDFNGVLWPSKQFQSIDKLKVKIEITFKNWESNQEETHDFSMPTEGQTTTIEPAPAPQTEGETEG